MESNSETEARKEKWRLKSQKYRLRNREKANEYSRRHIYEKRHPELKSKKRELRDYIIQNGHLPGEEIKKPELKRFPKKFPSTEFENKLEILLKDFPSEVSEKRLKDILYDIMDKKGNLSPIGLVYLLSDSIWENAINEFMIMYDYVKEGDKYVPKKK